MILYGSVLLNFFPLPYLLNFNPVSGLIEGSDPSQKIGFGEGRNLYAHVVEHLYLFAVFFMKS